MTGGSPAMTGGSPAMTGGVVIANPKGEAIQSRGVPSGLPRFARNDVGDGRNDAPSLRGAKRRSNPAGGGPHTGLLRFARNDEGLARNDGGVARDDGGRCGGTPPQRG
ncbi:MAG: hypothetical protein LBT00_13860 [Spirochaetaceae bacterium]|nr:hypothetical protein [Spirochaetaceae bacterium]